MNNSAIIICGPTASGKTAAANLIASKINGAIINADSMQIYKDLEIITSSPSQNNASTHLLYNFLEPSFRYSVAAYTKDVQSALNFCKDKGLVPIITGGTGLYIKGLVEGISEIPEISQNSKNMVNEILANGGTSALSRELRKLDPEMAAKLSENDTQRISRSLGVFIETGKSISDFQKNKSEPVLSSYALQTLYLRPERGFLYSLCEKRFDDMINNGAIEEVEIFCKKYPDLARGAVNSLGFSRIKSYLYGKASRQHAVNLAKQDTRNYAKRQYTWFNNQISWGRTILEYSSEDEFSKLLSKILL
ncbi:MAG: tRNA (adenosine(37)-N6)-dimethylallyltransferase MiaA [Rickettsiaceae bacterium]|nr:tRNA (adenosine(37)-N6)-dimethylallyltransferase MiaA [Rickettsiaceae bacterium]